MGVHADRVAKSPAPDMDKRKAPAPLNTIDALMHFQSLVGNRAMGQLLRANQNPGRTSSPRITQTTSNVQRLVIVLKDKKANKDEAKEDLTELNSIAFALSRTQGPVVTLSDADFSKVGKQETIFIIGHGSRGSASGHRAEDFLKVFLDQQRGIPHGSMATIVFTSCFAGADAAIGPGKFEPNSSLIAEISKQLKETRPGVTVIGGIGPTIKGNAVGDLFFVVKGDRDSVAKKERIKTQLTVQYKLDEQYASWFKKYKTEHNDKSPSLQEKAAAAAQLTEPFTKDYVKALLEEGLVYNPANPAELDTSMRAYKAGDELRGAMKIDLMKQVLSPRFPTGPASSNTPAPAANMSSSTSDSHKDPTEKSVTFQ